MGRVKVEYVEGITATTEDSATGANKEQLVLGEYSENKTVTQKVVATAELGYEIVTARGLAGVNTMNMTIASDKKSATANANVNFQGSTDFTYTLTTKTVPIALIHVTGSNISAYAESRQFQTGLIPLTINEDYVAEYNGWIYEVTVTADEGYIIDIAEYVKENGSDGFMVISEDGKTATASRVVNSSHPFDCNIGTIPTEPSEPMGILRVNGSNITATGEDITDGGDIPIDIELNTDIEVPINRSYKINVTADEGYLIDDAEYIKEIGSTGFMEISEDKKTATISRVVNEMNHFQCDIITSLKPVIIPAFIRVNGENATATIENTTASDGIKTPINLNEDIEVINGDEYKIVVTPNAEYKIDSLGYIKVNGAHDFGEVFHDGSYGWVTRVASETSKFVVYYDLIESQPPQDIAGFNYLYLVDREQLKSIANERFIGDEDLGQYIINVLELPFKLSSDEYGNETDIQLGNFRLKTRAIELLRDEIIIDFGEIVIPLEYNNSYDFINTETRLHVPYSRKIQLDMNYVVGQTIKVVYIIDLYTGDTTINVYSSLIDNIFHSETIEVGRDIPYITTFKGDKVNSISENKSLMNGLTKPFIEVVRNVPYQMSNPFNSDIIVQGSLFDVLGFIRVNSMKLKTTATINEKQRILMILKNGVEIK